jgi:predicted benzoate:H+ symporter BenE
VNLDQHRRHQDNIATTAGVLVAGLGLAGALSPLVEDAVTAALATLAGLAVLTALLRWTARRLRERREDAADALAGAAWRATHMPHLGRLPVQEQHGERAGVS